VNGDSPGPYGGNQSFVYTLNDDRLTFDDYGDKNPIARIMCEH
jgi:hypothetical protein